MKKRLRALFLAGCLTLSLAMPVMAEETTDITIDGTGAEYTAHQIMTLTTALKDANCHSGSAGTEQPDVFAFNFSDYTYVQDFADAINAVTPAYRAGYLTNGQPVTDANIQAFLAEIEKIIPDGSTWNELYKFHYASPKFGGGGGCNSFAYLISDWMFGEDAPLYKHQDFMSLKPGDALYSINGSGTSSHIMVVSYVEIDASDDYFYFEACDGNNSSSVSWNSFGYLDDFIYNNDGYGDNSYIYSRYTGNETPATSTSAGEHTADCWGYAYSVNPKYNDALQAVIPDSADANSDGTLSEAEIIQYISGMTSEGTAIRDFADALYQYILDNNIEADYTETDKTFSDIPQGYYLFGETKTSSTETQPDSTTFALLNTAGREKVTLRSKEETPTIVKKVQEVNDSTGASAYQDSADADVGDTVKFTTTVTIPDRADDYSSYPIIIHDEMATGLQLNPDSIEMTHDTVAFTSFTANTPTDSCSFELSIADAPSGVLVLQYEATVLESAVRGGNGNRNTTWVTFASNPYDLTETEETPKDIVSVFTYDLTVNKVTPNGNVLPGACFKLQKWDADTSAWVDDEVKTYDGTSTSFFFSGLDSGKYKLVETDVPPGYNKAADLEFEVEGDIPAASDNPTLTALNVKVDGEVVSGDADSGELFETTTAGSIVTAVVNTTGLQLPTTGGMGTYLFYGAGAVLLVSGAILVLKKRKDDDEDN